MGSKSKAGGRISGRVVPLTPSKNVMLTQFSDTARRLATCLDLSDAERVALKIIEERCRRELEKLKRADEQIRERVKLLDEHYARKRTERIEFAHRKSGFTNWTPRAPGSAFKPK